MSAATSLEVVKQQEPMQALAPQIYYTFGEIERMADAIAKSGLFGMKTKDQALALMLTAQAEGQHPATITQDYDIIQGRPARKTHSVLARFQVAGGRVQWSELSSTRAVATFSHPHGGSVEIEWTIEMARAAKLADKDNWKGYPRAMLRARCIAEGVRAVYPAAIGGMLIREEAEDLPAADGAVIDGNTGRVVEQPKARSKREPQQAAAPAGNAPKQETQPSSGEPEAPQPSSAPATPGGLTAGMLKTVRARITAAAEMVGLTEAKVCERFDVDKLEDIPAAKVNEVLAFVTNPD